MIKSGLILMKLETIKFYSKYFNQTNISWFFYHQFLMISAHFKFGDYHDFSGYNRQRQETLDESKENSLASAKYVHILDIGLLLH